MTLNSKLIKVLEKIVRKIIVAYVDKYELFNNTQHGFRHGRSCLSQLLAHYDQILSLLEEGNHVNVVFLDFAKAFGKVDFKIVLFKIKSLGITGKLYD